MLEFFKANPQLLRQLHHVRENEGRWGRGRGRVAQGRETCSCFVFLRSKRTLLCRDTCCVSCVAVHANKEGAAPVFSCSPAFATRETRMDPIRLIYLFGPVGTHGL